MITYVVKRGHCMGIRVGKNQAEVLAKERRAHGNETPIGVSQATMFDLEWCRGMGGHVPEDAEKYIKAQRKGKKEKG